MPTRIQCDGENSHIHLFTIKDNDGNAIDLTDYTVTLELTSKVEVITLTEGDGLTVESPTLGKVLMEWDAGDSPPVGYYHGSLIITKPGSRFTSRGFPLLVIT